MKMIHRGALAAMVVGSMAGGALGATVVSAASSSAATTTTSTPAAPTTANPPQGAAMYGGQVPGGVFHSNENATHEKGESAQREAQESAGKVPTVP